MDGVVSDVLQSSSDDNDDSEKETFEFSDTDLEVVSSTNGDRLQGSSSSGMDHEVAAGNQEARLGAISESQQHTRSLLSVLKAPTASNLSRKRVQAANPPSGKRRSRGTSTNDPKGIDPGRRIKEYPNEQFSVSNKKLFCKACREELSLKKSSVENHIKSSKHVKGKQRLSKKEAREKDLAESLRSYNEEVHLRGETLPQDQQVYRVKVLKAFLRAGIPLNKITPLRELLEESGYRLCDRRFMYDLIPFVVKEEEMQIKDEIRNKHVGVIFDGTTHTCEALAIVLRFMSDSYTVEQRLVRIKLLAKSLTGEEVARELIHVLSTSLGIDSQFVVATMRDRASVNNVAIRTMKIIYQNFLDIGCFSHTLDLVGNHFKFPNLTEFVGTWLALFSHSTKTKFLWKEQTGKAMASYSQTRWWSKWEVMQQLLVQFGDIKPFLTKNTEIGPHTRPRLLSFFEDTQKLNYLKIELAAVVDWGESFVKATYNLEGDGPLAFTCYEAIQTVIKSIQVSNIPNVQAVAKDISPNLTTQTRLITHAKQCVQPGLEYFKQQLDTSLKIPLMAFKAARLINPTVIRNLNPEASTVDLLRSFPFITADNITNLKAELPVYLAKSEDLDDSVDKLLWWKNQETSLPTWCAVVKKILLVQPSSAAVERVFSLLNSAFGDQQDQSLQDYIEASVMLRYNNR